MDKRFLPDSCFKPKTGSGHFPWQADSWYLGLVGICISFTLQCISLCVSKVFLSKKTHWGADLPPPLASWGSVLGLVGKKEEEDAALQVGRWRGQSPGCSSNWWQLTTVYLSQFVICISFSSSTVFSFVYFMFSIFLFLYLSIYLFQGKGRG